MKIKFWIISMILLLVTTLFTLFAFTHNSYRVEYDHNIELPKEINILICDSDTWNPLSNKSPVVSLEMNRKDLENFIINYRKDYELCLTDSGEIEIYMGDSKNHYGFYLSFKNDGEDIVFVIIMTLKDVQFDMSVCR